jgi:Trk K+ transport system NAD-binding subunit
VDASWRSPGRLPGLEGQTVVDATVPSVTECTILAVVRDGETITDADPGSFTFQADDEVVVAGTDESVDEFERRFGP